MEKGKKLELNDKFIDGLHRFSPDVETLPYVKEYVPDCHIIFNIIPIILNHLERS